MRVVAPSNRAFCSVPALSLRSSTPLLVLSYFCLWFGFCEVVAALVAAGADADGGSGREQKRKPRAGGWRGLLAI